VELREARERRRPKELRRGLQQLRRAGAGLCRALPYDARPPRVARRSGRARRRGHGGEGRRQRARARGGKVPFLSLDEKPDRSVVFISFGTLTRFMAAELREVARGLQLAIRKEFCASHERIRHGRIPVDARRLRRTH
jgi:hypothetical protein